MKPNVGFIMKDWKAVWEGEDLTQLIHGMPRDNVIETADDPSSDEVFMFSCPLTFVDEIRKDDDAMVTWFYANGIFDEHDGFHWDGEKLQVFYKGKLISKEEWEKITDKLFEER